MVKKSEKTANRKGYERVFLVGLILMMGLFMIGFASAYEFDNSLSEKTISKGVSYTLDKTEIPYNPIWEKYAPVEIDNLYGLGKNLMKGALTSHDETCGEDCLSEFTIYIGEESAPIEDIRFVRLDEGKEEIRDIRSYQLSYLSDIEDFSYECSVVGKELNGSDITTCENINVGTHKGYLPYSIGTKLPSGTYDFKLEGKKAPYMSIDWQITTQGKLLESWATWGNISTGSQAEVVLVSPTNASTQYTKLVTTNASGNVTGGAYLVNATLYDNSTGTWGARNVTTGLTLGGTGAIDGAFTYNSGGVTTSYTGMRILTTSKPNNRLKNVTVDGSVVATTMYLLNSTGGGAGTDAVIASSPIVGGVATFDYPLTTLTYYFLAIGGGQTYRQRSGATYTYSGTGVSFTTGLSNNALEAGYTFVITNVGTYNISTSNFSSQAFTNNYSSGQSIKWNYRFCDTDGACGFAIANRTFNIDSTPPSVVLNYPTNLIDYGATNGTLQLNFTATDTNLDKCWYNYAVGTQGIGFISYVQGDNNITVSCSSGVPALSNITLNKSIDRLIYFWANDTAGNLNTSYFSWDYRVFENNRTYSNQTFALSTETYSINTTGTIDYGYLVFNGTQYLLITSGSISSVTINIPESAIGTQNFFFRLISGGSEINTSSSSQIVYSLGLQDCVLGGYPVLNLSIKDEELNTLLNVTSPNTAKVEAELIISSLGDPDISVHYDRTWNNNQTMAICLSNTTTQTYKVDIVLGYEGTDHVKEFWYLDNGTLNLSSNYFNPYTLDSLNLMDLLTADSTTFLFKYTDENGQIVPRAIVHTFRKYIGEGLFREVERSKQDDNGQTHVHLVEEDVIYYFMTTLDGQILFTSDEYNAKCLSSPCSIELSSSATAINWSIIDNEGGKYVITTDKNTRIVTTTFNIGEVDLVNASLYKFENGTYSLINSSSITSASGSIGLYVPIVYGNQTFFIAIYRDNTFIKSAWVDLRSDAKDIFGTFGMVLGGIVVLALLLMAVSEGVGVIIFLCVGLIAIMIMGLIDLTWLALISIVCAGGIIVWKLVNRQGRRG